MYRAVKGEINMTLEEIGNFLDTLYHQANLYNDFSLYNLSKEYYENNGYYILFDGTHIVNLKSK